MCRIVGLAVIVIALAIAIPAQSQNRPLLAVMDIQDRTGALSADVIDNLTEYLRGLLAESGKYTVIDRSRQAKAIRDVLQKERKETHKACYERSCQVPVGRILAADQVLLTTFMKVGSQFMLKAEILRLDTEASSGGATARGVFVPTQGLEDRVVEALDTVAGKLAEQRGTFVGALTPTEVSSGERESSSSAPTDAGFDRLAVRNTADSDRKPEIKPMENRKKTGGKGSTPLAELAEELNARFFPNRASRQFYAVAFLVPAANTASFGTRFSLELGYHFGVPLHIGGGLTHLSAMFSDSNDAVDLIPEAFVALDTRFLGFGVGLAYTLIDFATYPDDAYHSDRGGGLPNDGPAITIRLRAGSSAGLCLQALALKVLTSNAEGKPFESLRFHLRIPLNDRWALYSRAEMTAVVWNDFDDGLVALGLQRRLSGAWAKLAVSLGAGYSWFAVPTGYYDESGDNSADTTALDLGFSIVF